MDCLHGDERLREQRSSKGDSQNEAGRRQQMGRRSMSTRSSRCVLSRGIPMTALRVRKGQELRRAPDCDAAKRVQGSQIVVPTHQVCGRATDG